MNETASKDVTVLRRARYHRQISPLCKCKCHKAEEACDCGCCYDLSEKIAEIVDVEVQEAHALGLRGRGLDGKLLRIVPFVSDTPKGKTDG